MPLVRKYRACAGLQRPPFDQRPGLQPIHAPASPFIKVVLLVNLHADGFPTVDDLPLLHRPGSRVVTPPGTFSLPTLSHLDATSRLHPARMGRGSHFVPSPQFLTTGPLKLYIS